ncbi:MAG: hypothetical protein JJ974_01220 [Phycisphaerales bacterium]|nr:hypothetical protein [Phycisphaerales bacterium]
MSSDSQEHESNSLFEKQGVVHFDEDRSSYSLVGFYVAAILCTISPFAYSLFMNSEWTKWLVGLMVSFFLAWFFWKLILHSGKGVVEIDYNLAEVRLQYLPYPTGLFDFARKPKVVIPFQEIKSSTPSMVSGKKMVTVVTDASRFSLISERWTSSESLYKHLVELVV